MREVIWMVFMETIELNFNKSKFLFVGNQGASIDDFMRDFRKRSIEILLFEDIRVYFDQVSERLGGFFSFFILWDFKSFGAVSIEGG